MRAGLGGKQRRWIDRRDPEDVEGYLAGHIRRTRIELAARPELFGPTPRRRR